MNDTQDLLSQLRDIQTPAVSFMPAPGWWVVLGIAILLAFCAYRLRKRYQRRGWQREARLQLKQLRAQAGSVPVSQTLSAASRLSRRVVLAVRPREDVASLKGEAWLAELDAICGNSSFRQGFGNLLEHGPYQANPSLGHDDLNALMDVVSELIDSAGRMPPAHSGQ